MPAWESMVLVGRVARPHGIRGLMVVNPETDFVDERFGRGATVWMLRDGVPVAMTIAASQLGGRRPVIGFDGVATVDDAESFSGQELRVPEAELMPLPAGAYYHHQLVGCTVTTVAGADVGEVIRVDGGESGSLLVITGARGEVLVPLTTHICVEVDVAARRITVAPPDGLLELNERTRRG